MGCSSRLCRYCMFCLFSRIAGEKLGLVELFHRSRDQPVSCSECLRLGSISGRDNRLLGDPRYSFIYFHKWDGMHSRVLKNPISALLKPIRQWSNIFLPYSQTQIEPGIAR